MSQLNLDVSTAFALGQISQLAALALEDLQTTDTKDLDARSQRVRQELLDSLAAVSRASDSYAGMCRDLKLEAKSRGEAI